MAMDSVLVLAGSGHGGIDEMQAFIDTGSVMWALCRLEFGQGSFRRQKMLCLRLNGQDCPAVARGQANGHAADVFDFFRGHGESCHATLELDTKAEVTADTIFQRVRHIFVSDNLGVHSIDSMLADYKIQIQNAAAERAAAERVAAERRSEVTAAGHQSNLLAAPTTPCSASAGLVTCRSRSFVTGPAALKNIGDYQGPCAWVLIGPDPVNLPLVASGVGIEELRSVLSSHSQSVLYGIIRLPAGAGSLQRTRHVFIHSIGENASAFRRGRDGFWKPKMRRAFTDFVDMPISVEIARTTDLSCEMIIEKIRRASVADDFFLCDQCVDVLKASIEKELAPLPAEAAPLIASSEQQCAPSAVAKESEAATDLLPEEAVRQVCQPGSHLNWALFSANVGLLRARRSSLAQAKPRSSIRRGSCGGA
jgi:hypothetical protein